MRVPVGVLRARVLRAMVVLPALVLLPSCYLGTRMGPAFHQTPDGTSRAGFEWDVTGGIELQIDKPSKINPLEGETRMALGAGGLSTSGDMTNEADGTFAERMDGAPGTPPMDAGGPGGPESFNVVAGFGTLEAAHTIFRDVYSRDGRGMATGGALVRVAGSVGMGGGTATLYDDDARSMRWGDASMTFTTLGVEGGWHAQSKDTSIGVLFGAGVRYTTFDAGGLMRGATVSPFVSVQIEGIALLQAVMIMAQSGGGCR